VSDAVRGLFLAEGDGTPMDQWHVHLGGRRHRDRAQGESYHRFMTDASQQQLTDLLKDAQGALIELEGRLPGENEDVAGARRSWERATRAVSDALALMEPEE
jgi:hypothetical protein